MENSPNAGGGGPLDPCSPDRVNQGRPQSALLSPLRGGDSRDSSVHEKITQFNSLASHGKQLERKAADAALTRAMIGREEAESEMRRYRDEARALRKHVEEGKERERRVGQRMEEIMEKYIRLKEMHQHTQSVWEKEIRRQRKEYFKANSSGVKYAEELKTTKEALRTTEASLAREKERARAREQEAFAARYQIVGVESQLGEALERIKLVEQERDAFKTLAKNEEVARIAAEGCIPLPPPENDDDEFASPKKERAPLLPVDVVSSLASEEEIEELTRRVEWERQRADRAQEHVDFLVAECELRCCPCAKTSKRRSILSPRRARPQMVEILDAGDLAILSDRAVPQRGEKAPAPRREETPEEGRASSRKSKEKRRSTIFCPQEGIFRTVSQEEAAALGGVPEEARPAEEPTPAAASPPEPRPDPAMYARTPSVEPPSFALLAQERTSLMSLLNAPHGAPRESDAHDQPVIPTMAAPTEGREPEPEPERLRHSAPEEEAPKTRRVSPAFSHPAARPHTSNSFYTVTTTTTVPIREKPVKRISNKGQRPPSRADEVSFDVNNPAMTPTMTREEALAQIRERRGRARSAAQGAATPRRQMLEGVGRRDISAPTGRGAKSRT